MPKPLKVLQASAGSGKTFSLTAHYLTLLFTGKNAYREILAVTFTNKATEEMKSRILQVLAGLARGDDKYSNVREIILEAHSFLNAGLLKIQAREHYQQILHDFGSFSVNTIDGFVQKVIRGFAFELGIDPGYGLEMNTSKVIEDVANRLNDKLSTNPGLLKWIINLAIDRIENDKTWNYHDDLIKLAEEIFKERFQPFDQALQKLLLDQDSDTLFDDYSRLTKITICDFETALKKVIAEAAVIFGDANTDILQKKTTSPLNALTKVKRGLLDESQFSKLSTYIDNPDIWIKKEFQSDLYQRLNPVLIKLFKIYDEGLPAYNLAKIVIGKIYYLRLMQEMTLLLKDYRKESGSLLISDAPLLLQGIAGNDSGNPSFIWEKMGNRYTHFLFDEFQDTSVSQWNSFRPLLENALASPTEKYTDHLIVGDVKQAIYRWRNGDWNILHSGIKTAIGTESIIEEQLDSNYRSTEQIIEFNNVLFDFAPGALQLILNQAINDEGNSDLLKWWQINGYDSLVTGVYAQAPQLPHAKTLKGGSVYFKVLRTDEEVEEGSFKIGAYRKQALQLSVHEIRRLVSEKGYSYNDISILVTVNAEAAMVVQALMLAGIPVISGDALKIAGNIAVKLILNTLKVLSDVTPESAINKASCISLYAALRKVKLPVQSFIGLENRSIESLEGLLPLKFCRSYQNWVHLPLAELVEKVIGAYELNLPVYKEHLAYLFAFRDLVTLFTANGESGLSSFLDWWNKEGCDRCLPSADGAKAVQVFTIHKSKGLAFRAVLIPFCNWLLDGKANTVFWVPTQDTQYHKLASIPVTYSKALAKSPMAHAYFEELLFNYMDAINKLYVAATRTREHLYIICQGSKPGVEAKSGYKTIGQMLTGIIKLFPAYKSAFIDNDTLVIDYPVIEQDKKNTDIAGLEILQMREYPLSDRLSEVLSIEAVSSKLDKLSNNISLREGSILHDILSRLTNIAELDAVLQGMRSEGLIKEFEMAHFNRRTSLVLNHPDLQNLLNDGGRVMNEKSIISATGKSYRPDKVLIGDNHVTILDYKFTLNEDNAHIRQVKGYEDLLNEMGYTQVNTYLFYALTGNLKKV